MRCLPALLLLCACAEHHGDRPPPLVCAVNYPLQYFGARIAGGHPMVVCLVPAGEDPAYWRPDDGAIAGHQLADVILLNGAGYAKWTARASLQPSRCVETSAAFSDRLIRVERPAHMHGPTGGVEHGGVAFTTWLDLELAVAQARAIRDAFVERWPGRRAVFEAGFADLRRDLLELDRQLQAAVPKESLLVSHPVYQYWARRYGADVKSVHWEPDVVPDGKEWAELERIRGKARRMIWEAAPAAETARKLRDLGIACVVFDPCASVPTDGDFLTVMRRNLANLN